MQKRTYIILLCDNYGVDCTERGEGEREREREWGREKVELGEFTTTGLGYLPHEQWTD